MKSAIALIMLVLILSISPAMADDGRQELIRLWGDVVAFEKEMPFFTKSRLNVFFSFDNSIENADYNGAFYGIYLNNNLVKTGILDIKGETRGKEFYMGSFPARSGNSIVSVRISRGKNDSSRKFEVTVPEFRLVALQLVFADNADKPRMIPRAWIVE